MFAVQYLCNHFFKNCYPIVFPVNQNIYCVPCIPLCDITVLYVLHILSLKAKFLLTLGVMVAQY